LDRLRAWALETERRRGHNKATVALANKIARIVWATWKHSDPSIETGVRSPVDTAERFQTIYPLNASCI
jgi:hypothetical protein